MENTKNYFYGIDLGTTNSVMAYGNITNTGVLKPIVVLTEKVKTGAVPEGNFFLPLSFIIKITKDEWCLKLATMQKAVMGRRADM